MDEKIKEILIEKINHKYLLDEQMSNSLERSWKNTVAEPEIKNLILEPSNLIPDIITQISKKVMEYIYKEDKPLFQKLTIEDGTKNEIIKDLIKHEKETSQR